MSAKSTEQKKRVGSIDIARALAVIGVVCTHAVDGMVGAGIIDEGYAFNRIMDDAGLFRLPTLDLILGLFIPVSLAKRGQGNYVLWRTTYLMYLFFIWTVVQGSLMVVFSGQRNFENTWVDIFTFWKPLNQLWYLNYVALATVVLGFTMPWINRRRTWIAMILALVVAYLFWNRNEQIIFLHGTSLLFFSTIGALVGLPRAVRIVRAVPFRYWIGIFVASVAAFLFLLRFDPVLPAMGEEGVSLAMFPASLFATCSGVAMLLAAAVILDRVPYVSQALQYVGKNTLEIFVMHYVAYAAMRVFLQRALGVEDPITHLVVGVGFGIGSSMIAAWLLPRIGLGWLFRMPESFTAWLDRLAKRRPIPAPQQTAVNTIS